MKHAWCWLKRALSVNKDFYFPSPATVHQQLTKGLTHQQINLLRPIMRSQAPGTATQAQQLRAQKLSFTVSGLNKMLQVILSV